MVAYIWLDPQVTSYSCGYNSLWSLADLVHAPGWSGLIIVWSLVAGPPEVVIIILNIRSESHFQHQVLILAVAMHHNRLASIPLPRLEQWKDLVVAATLKPSASPGHGGPRCSLVLRPNGDYASVNPGTVGMTAVLIIQLWELLAVGMA